MNQHTVPNFSSMWHFECFFLVRFPSPWPTLICDLPSPFCEFSRLFQQKLQVLGFLGCNGALVLLLSRIFPILTFVSVRKLARLELKKNVTPEKTPNKNYDNIKIKVQIIIIQSLFFVMDHCTICMLLFPRFLSTSSKTRKSTNTRHWLALVSVLRHFFLNKSNCLQSVITSQWCESLPRTYDKSQPISVPTDRQPANWLSRT